MKIRSLVAAALFAAAAVSGAAHADNDKATAPADKAAAKPHSHVQEKTGIPQNAPDTKADKANAAKDKSTHYHPRDGKQ